MTKNPQKHYKDIESALQRLKWRLENGKFNPNQNDWDAYDNIAQWVDDQRQIAHKENPLFNKLIVYHLTLLARKYETYGLNREVQKELSRILDTSFEILLEDLLGTLTHYCDIEIIESNGIELKHPLLKSDEERESDCLKDRNMSLKDLNSIKYGTIDKEGVRDEVDKIIVEALNRFS